MRTTLTFAAGLLVGCWTGASSQGLPCEDNRHCGLGDECIDGFCGGQASDALCGNGFLDPGEECDDAEQNSNEGACLPDCTAQTCGDGFLGPGEDCDEGEANDNRGDCKQDCTAQICGDGFVGPGEECDTEPVDGVECGSTCVLQSCGNGLVEGSEACDEGGESATCDDDCSAVTCGDGNVNEAAGEACDNGQDGVDTFACMRNCTVPILWDDMEADTPDVNWEHAKVSGDDTVADTWMVNSNNTAEGSEGAWDSGRPAPTVGDTRLMTPPLDLSDLAGQTLELRFDHARVFSDCDEPTVPYEGAVVEVAVDGGPFEVITPDDGYTGPIGDGMCTPPNPLAGVEGFTLDSNYRTETFDLSAFAGSSIVVGFRVGWDCGNCDANPDRGWFIDNVAVWQK